MNNTTRARRTALAIAPLVIALCGFGGQAAQAAPAVGSLAPAGPITVSRLAGPAQIATIESGVVTNSVAGNGGAKTAQAKKTVAKKAVAKKAAAKKAAAKKVVTKKAAE